MWTHSSSLRYIQARPWLISMLTASLLKPKFFRSTVIHIPSTTCPFLDPTDVKQNTLIKEKLRESVFYESSQLISQKANGTYYGFELTTEGDYLQYEIPIFDGNIFLLLCIILSCIIMVVGVIYLFIFFFIIKNKFESYYFKHMKEVKKFQKAKKQIENGKEDKPQTYVNDSGIVIERHLIMGTFTARLVDHEVDLSKLTTEQKAKLRQSKQKIDFSIYQAPVLLVEHISRKYTNSFDFFLSRIYESGRFFSEFKMSNDSYLEATSVRIDLLRPMYLDFCTSEGVRPLEISKELEVIKKYNLSIEWKSDSTTSAYTNIRLKTSMEKNAPASNIKQEPSGDETAEDGFNEEETIIKQFLRDECKKSSFSTDYILVTDLLLRYNKYCREKSIDDLHKLDIQGCPELVDFGASFKSSYQVPYLRGVVIKDISGLKDTIYVAGLLRMPRDSKSKKSSTGMIARAKELFNHLMYSNEGILYNVAIVALHLAFILGVPLLWLLLIVWSLLQLQLINEDIYDKVYSLDDVFNGSSYEHWLYHLPYVEILYAFLILSALFIIAGMIELICFYATGAREIGKHIVKKTFVRWIITLFFWFMVVLYVSLYTAYITVLLIWCILGAVLAPEKFLPLAVGAGVWFAFIYLLYSRLKKMDSVLKDIVSEVVDKELKISIVQTFKEQQAKITKSIEDPVSKMFNKTLNMFMQANGLPKIDKADSDEIMRGNMDAIVNVLNKTLGVSPFLGMALLGYLRKDQEMIRGSISELSVSLGLDPELNLMFVDAAMTQLDYSSIGLTNIQGTVVSTMKSILKKAYPSFPVGSIDDTLQLILNVNPAPLKALLKNFNVPTGILEIIICMLSYKENEITASVENAVKGLFEVKGKKESIENQIWILFRELLKTYKGNTKGSLKNISSRLGFKHEFLLKVFIVLFKKDNDLSRHSLLEIVKAFSKSSNTYKITSQKRVNLENYLLALHTILEGESYDMLKILKDNVPGIDHRIGDTLVKATKGSSREIEMILDVIGLRADKNAVMEFHDLLHNKSATIHEISSRVGVFDENYRVFESLMKLLIVVPEIYIRIRPKCEELKKQPLGEDAEARQRNVTADTRQLNMVLKEMKQHVSSLLMVCFKAGAIDVQKYNQSQSKIKFLLQGGISGGAVNKAEINREEQIEANYNEEESKDFVEKIVKTIFESPPKNSEKAFGTVVDLVMKYLELSKENIVTVKAFATIAMSYRCDISMKEEADAEKSPLPKAFRLTSKLLRLDEDLLYFVLDIFSGNPLRVLQ